MNFWSTRQMTTLGLFSAVGISLFVLESFIPTPLPFLKIGLANISSLLALMLFGAREMFLVLAIRVVVGSVLTGSLFGPGFLLAISGGICSALAMGGVRKIAPGLFSVIGISLVGSMTHVTVQFLFVLLFYVQNPAVLFLLPLLLASALAGGLVVGWISARLIPILKSIRLAG